MASAWKHSHKLQVAPAEEGISAAVLALENQSFFRAFGKLRQTREALKPRQCQD